MASASSSSGSRDRLSDLPDDVLGHILSFLPTKPAGRAAALSRRWRHVFSNVNTVSFEEQASASANTIYHDWNTTYHDSQESQTHSTALLKGVWSALLCRRRCAGFHVPLHRLRVAFNSCPGWNRRHVDQWLSYVLRHSRKDLHLDLCFRLGPTCAHRGHDDDTPRLEPGSWYQLPRGLLSCTAMRSLCLSYCSLNLPGAISLPFLETLRLTGVDHGDSCGSSIQRLIASCPCLLDLTLEANNKLQKVSILDKRLRRFALWCCHSIKSVDIDASELVSLDYRGTVPPESLLSLHGSPEKIIPLCTVDFCKIDYCMMAQRDGIKINSFFEEISNTKRLHLHHRQIPFSYNFQGLPLFPNLTQLALQGGIQSPNAVRGILRQTPNLQVLWLLMEFPVLLGGKLEPPNEATFSVPCLQHRVREINMIHYQGDELQSTVAMLLLRNALVLERLCVVFVKGSLQVQAGRKKDIQRWVVAADAQQFFL